jgi:hypothetical protein
MLDYFPSLYIASATSLPYHIITSEFHDTKDRHVVPKLLKSQTIIVVKFC